VGPSFQFEEDEEEEQEQEEDLGSVDDSTLDPATGLRPSQVDEEQHEDSGEDSPASTPLPSSGGSNTSAAPVAPSLTTNSDEMWNSTIHANTTNDSRQEHLLDSASKLDWDEAEAETAETETTTSTRDSSSSPFAWERQRPGILVLSLGLWSVALL